MNHIYKTTDKNLRIAMFKAFGGKCFYSGRPIAEDDFDIDHIVPASKGGKDSVFNYVVASKDINHKKNNICDDESVIKILYIVKTVYAPKVLKILSTTTPHIPQKLSASEIRLPSNAPMIHLPTKNLKLLKGISGMACYVYFLFRSKIEYAKNTDKIIVVSNVVTFSYLEAEKAGISNNVFSKAIKILKIIKLIEITIEGTFGGRQPTTYTVY